jgi:hypothetical protein
MAFSTQDKVPTWDAVEKWLHNAALKFYANSAYAKQALRCYDVLANGVVVGRIFKANAVSARLGCSAICSPSFSQASTFVQVGISALWACASLLASRSAIFEANGPLVPHYALSRCRGL